MVIIIWFLLPIISVLLIKNRLLQYIISIIISVVCLWVYSIGNMSASAKPDFDAIFLIFIFIFTLASIIYCLLIVSVLNWIAKKILRKSI